MTIEKRFIKNLVAVYAAIILMFMISFAALDAAAAPSKSIASGLIWVVDKTTSLSSLTIADGAFVMAPDGYSVTMTVNGVETGIVPGIYKGDIVLSLTQENAVKYKELTHYFRQALYLDENGVNVAKSVLPAAGNYKYSNGTLFGAEITSVGENFNGIFVKGGTHTIKDVVIDFAGNGGDDFAGYGAAVMATGKNTTLILDNANIMTHGAVRTGVIATRNSTVIVKNSTIRTKNGILPADYIPNVELGRMLAVPWMLGLSGNNRATNLLGRHAMATYINSSISSESWGILSVDGDDETQEPVEADYRERKLTAINCKLTHTGGYGYGNYSHCSYYGCDLNVGDYASIGSGIFAASNTEIITELNAELNLGLTESEINSLPQTGTHVKSGRFGLMARGTVKVMDDTTFDTEKAVFLVKGGNLDLNVDGSKGAQLNSRNGIIIQILENDDPGRINAIYHEAADPEKADDFDVTAINESDVIATFSNITLKGDFYNGFPGGYNNSKNTMTMGVSAGVSATGAPGSTGGSASTGGAAAGGPDTVVGGGRPANVGKNMVLNMENTNITGTITSSRAKHAKPIITSEDYLMLGEVTNTPGPAVNNGVIVSLNGSTWTVTGTSYLTNLTIGKGSSIKAPKGYKVKMTVDGSAKAIKAGSYKGNIVITVIES